MKISSFFQTGLALGALAAAAGCSGSGSAPVAPAPHAAPSSAGSVPSSFGKSNASATVTINSRSAAKRAARAGRKRDYISAATQGIIIKFVDSESPSVTTYQGLTLAPGTTATAASPAACTAAAPDGSYTCTLYFALSSTNSPYTATLTAYDAPQSGTTGMPAAASGASSAVALSTDTETLTVVANQSNNFAFDLHGIVEAFETVPQYIGVPASPAPNATPLATTFHALDGDDYIIDAVDGTTTFYTGSQPGGPFAAASFAVTATDENTCSSSPCVALASPAPAIADPTTEGISFSYAGGGTSGDGTAANPPYYGLIGATGPAGYGGRVSATVGGTAYAATAYVVPFFGIVDQSTKNAAASDASDVSFTSPSDSVNLLALQYHLPTTSTGYAVDTSACGSIASASAGTALASGYGESFTLTPGSQSGTCAVTLSDGAGDTATINVTSTAAGAATITVPCASPSLAPDVATLGKVHAKRAVTANCPTPPTVVESASGTIPSNDTESGITVKNPGDVLYCTVSFTNDAFVDSNVSGNFNRLYDTNANVTPGLYTIYVDTANAGDYLKFYEAKGPSSYLCYEFANTSVDAITGANPNYATQDGGTTQTIGSMAASVVLSFVVSNSNSAYNISPGWQDAGEVVQGAGSIQGEKLVPPYSASVSNTFAGGDGMPVSASIIEIPVTSSSADAQVRRKANVLWNKGKHDMLRPQ